MTNELNPLQQFVLEPHPHTVKMAALLELAQEVNGTAKNRTIGEREAELLLQRMATCPSLTQRIIVYSQDGFVSPTYYGEATIRFFKAERDGKGEWCITAGSCDAKARNRRTITIYPYAGAEAQVKL